MNLNISHIQVSNATFVKQLFFAKVIKKYSYGVKNPNFFLGRLFNFS